MQIVFVIYNSNLKIEKLQIKFERKIQFSVYQELV